METIIINDKVYKYSKEDYNKKDIELFFTFKVLNRLADDQYGTIYTYMSENNIIDFDIGLCAYYLRRKNGNNTRAN